MVIQEIIDKKRLNFPLSKEEIEFVIKGFTNHEVLDCQMSALLMAICINGMNEEETDILTNAMLESGKILDFSGEEGIFTDKHSTGGVSDSTTLVLLPIIACSGLKMLKMSGKALGHTGGTLDKFACFKGYQDDLSIEKAKEVVSKFGGTIIAQTEVLAVADKFIYNLRDLTSTFQSIPLIASSIMSKKLACGNDIIVLDVKCGNGAFMETLEDAEKLAKTLVKIGNNAGKKTFAYVTDMSQPLGNTIGNILEVEEAIGVLSGEKSRLEELSLVLASKIIELGKNISNEEAKNEVEKIISSGSALKKLKEIISNQNGSLDLFNKKENQEKYVLTHLYSDKTGYVASFNTKRIGELARQIEKNGKGIIINKKIGDFISEGEPIVSFVDCKEVCKELLTCIEISQNRVASIPVVLSKIN